jgi:valyl-tRNA synthetase
MKKEFPKSFEPQSSEKKWYNKWIDNGIFKADNTSKKPSYSILMPPPNVTGILHFGHVLNLTIQDLYIRSKRMQGFETCWFAGTDHAGIATQSKVEAELRKNGISRYDLGREKFTEKVWEWKEKYGGIILQQMRELGVSVDWDRNLFTMDATASKAVTEVFVKLFDEGLIYKGKRIINWSPLAQTALSDEEVIFKEVQGHLYTLRYYLEDEPEKYILLSTVRPETIFGDTAVAVNPNDERYKSLVGKRVRVPLTERFIEIITDDYADPKFGTGAVKITPAHDPNDFLVGQRHNLQTIQTINPDGTLNELTGKFNKLERFEARKAIIEDLKAENYIEKIENYTHNVGFSERGGEPIEPYLSDQWFVKMKSIAEDALKVVLDEEIKFYPQHWVKTYSHWMTNVRDWCISRQLWWGHRIPVYYDLASGKFTAARNENEAREKLQLPANVALTQDEDSLDTWFSSWLWPLTTMRWLENDKAETADMKKFLPTDLLVTAPEIIFFWVARMIISTKKFAKKIPFKNVYFTSIIRDGKGQKLSKSLGNSPDPLNIIAKYGADAVRFSMIFLAPLGQDVRMDVDVKEQDISSMEIGRNFMNKVWNAGRFILMKQDEAGANSSDNSLNVNELSYADKWIISRYNSTIEKISEALDNYKVTEYAKIIYDFIWRDFCDWYVEVLKIQLNQNQNNENYNKRLIRFTTRLYENILKILHPVMPFITEEIFHLIENRDENESISVTEFPKFDKNLINFEIEEKFELIQNIVEEVRKLRASINIPSQKLPATISVKDEKTLEIFNNLKAVLMNLCKISDLNISVNAPKPEGATSTVFREIEIHLIIADSIDLGKEKERLEKEAARLERNISGSEKKLSNEKFVTGASAEIVENERVKLISMQESLKKVKENLANLK